MKSLCRQRLEEFCFMEVGETIEMEEMKRYLGAKIWPQMFYNAKIWGGGHL